MRRYPGIIAVAAAVCIAAPLAAQGTSRTESKPDTVSIANPTMSTDSLASQAVIAARSAAPAVTPTTPAVASTLSLAPTRASTVAGLQLRTEGFAPAPAPVPAAGRNSHNMAMIIVGGAALIVGSMVEGDAGRFMMIGGGVLGLWGLWQYLQ